MTTEPIQPRERRRNPHRWDVWLFPAAVALIVGIWVLTRFGNDSGSDLQQSLLAGANSHDAGTLVGVAQGRYHVQPLLQRPGTLRLFTLGSDPSMVMDVEQQTLEIWIQADEQPAISLRLASDPQTDDPPGRTSQFVVDLPEDWIDRSLQVTIPSMRIAGQRFRLAFLVSPEDANLGMPEKVTDEEEQQLYLTAGGLYSQADITANGNLTASQKFKGFRAKHDFNPQSGDALCPITRTKANPDCYWIIGGQRYEFCCPPCIDEFVRLAKEQPEQIESPDVYIK